MEEREIRKYAELMRETGLTGLEITRNNTIVRLERSPSAPVVYSGNNGTASPLASSQAVSVSEEGTGLLPFSGKTAAAKTHSVLSPLVGVFYAAPTENAPPFVKVGDTVCRGQTLCIIEAMKLMNEITAEEDGTVTEVCATNGQVVEYGTELFRLRREKHGS